MGPHEPAFDSAIRVRAQQRRQAVRGLRRPAGDDTANAALEPLVSVLESRTDGKDDRSMETPF